MLRDALLAICDGEWDAADRALSRRPQHDARDDPAYLNVSGVFCQARGKWTQARRCFRKALRVNRRYLPAEQNLRRIYELETFGKTLLPIAMVDQTTLIQMRNISTETSPRQLDQLDVLKSISPSVPDGATIR